MEFAAGAGITNVDLMYGGLTHLPQEGEEVYAPSFSMQLGGGIPATLVNMRRLGISTRIVTAFGPDIFSSFAQDMFLKNGVEPYNFCQEDRIPVNVTTVMLTPSDRTFLSYTEERPLTSAQQEEVYHQLRGAKLALMNPGYLDIYRRLHEEGTILVFDMGWDEEMSLEKYHDCLTLADYFTPNIKEALTITGTDTPEDAAAVLERYFPRVVVKLDAEGCLLRENGKNRRVGRIPEYVHQDSTGAGDAFLAGFSYGLFHNRPFSECVLLGNITGGKCVTAMGCLSAWFNEAELLEMERKYRYLLEE